MSQVTSGIRALLSHPVIYEVFQNIMGAHKARREFVVKFIEPYPVEFVLDIGCGPANILPYLPEVNYYGFDISETYIADAKKKYGDKGNFFAKNLTYEDIDSLPKFDFVLLSGILHHVDDETVIQILKLAKKALKPKGRVVAIDGCLVDGQNPIARFLINHDRGQNVKTEEGYRQLAMNVFNDVETTISHSVWIPYTLCYTVCKL